MRHPARVDGAGGAGVPSAKAQIPRAYRHAAISHLASQVVGKAESRGILIERLGDKIARMEYDFMELTYNGSPVVGQQFRVELRDFSGISQILIFIGGRRYRENNCPDEPCCEVIDIPS